MSLSCSASVANICFDFDFDWCQWSSNSNHNNDPETEVEEERILLEEQQRNNPTTFLNRRHQHQHRRSGLLKSQNSLLLEAASGCPTPSSTQRYPTRRESLEELAHRFLSTQQLLFETNSPKQRERIVQNVRRQSLLRQDDKAKSNRLRNAMILTMLSSGDHAVQQSALDAARNNSPMIVNPYQVLQVRRDATPSEIRQAYRRLALWHHPGRTNGAGPAERHRRLQVFEILSASYETLLDRETRTRCDLLLRESYAEHARSKNIPAGQVCVGGKPLETKEGTGTNGKNANRDPETFMARVIGRLAVRAVADETEDDMSGAKILPNMEPVSSDSSLEPPDAVPDDLTDCSSDASGLRLRPPTISIHTTPNTVGTPKAAPSPRIHMPLGTPLTTPRASSPGDSSITNESPRHHGEQPNESFLSIGACGMNTLNSFDSQPALPALLNSSSTAEPQRGGEIHYTEGETNRLFGGPLQLLYRARRWRPFKDPFEVFCEVFGSRVPLGGKPEMEAVVASSENAQAPLESPSSLLLPAQNSSAGWTGTSETLADGTVLFRTSRILHHRKITRTERVRIDPETGLRHSHVTVTSESLEEEPQDDVVPSSSQPNAEDEDAFSFWSYFTCEPLLMSCEGIGCTTTLVGNQVLDGDEEEEGIETTTKTDHDVVESNDMFCGSGLSWCM